MAITIIQAIVPSSEASGFDIPLFAYNEVNSATYKKGAPLTPSSGKLTEATGASPTTAIIGFAQQAGQNLASAPVYPSYGLTYPAGAGTSGVASTAGAATAVAPLLYAPALPTVIFEGTFANGGADVAIAVTDMWTSYGLTKDATSGLWYVDKAKTTTNGSVIVVGVKNPQDVTFGTTTGARVYFIVKESTSFWN